METLLLTFGLSCGACLALTPLVRRLATRFGLVDRPDGRRKLHGRTTPVAGGLAILSACVGAVALVFAASDQLGLDLEAPNLSHLGLLLAGVTICLVGVADDYGSLRGSYKLMGQLVAVGIVISFGLVIRSVWLFGWRVELGVLAVPFTVFWLIGAINALNLIDGMDGLLSSVGLIVTLAIAAMAVLNGRLETAVMAVALAGALLGFLRYNFPPASIFLGDCGSMLIGLVVGVLAIQGALVAPATITLATPAALLTIPFLDTLAAIVRRKLTGRSVYTTDRGHLHHCLLRRGYSNRRALGVIAFACLVTVLGALASLALRNELFAVLTAATVVGVFVTTHVFGYVEYLLLKERFLGATRLIWRGRSACDPREVEVRLQGQAPWSELWRRLTACAGEMGLVSMRLNVNAPALHEGYHARWDCPPPASEETDFWRAELPLLLDGQTLGRLEVCGRRTLHPVARHVADLAAIVDDLAFLGLVPVQATPAVPSPEGSDDLVPIIGVGMAPQRA